MKRTIVTRTDEDGDTILHFGDTRKELAEILGITPSAVTHGLKTSPHLYHLVEIDDDDEEEDMN